MSNVLYKDGVFNEEIKREYLERYGEGTQKTILRIFKASALLEKEIGRDLYAFNRGELRRFFYTLRPAKLYSSGQNISLVSKYITWAILKKYKAGLNPLESIPKDWYKQFVDMSSKDYFTEDELNKFVEECTNAQDAVIIKLIMNGVLGEASEELLNLQQKHIDFENNKLILIDNIKNTNRTLTVDEDTIKLCRQALQAVEYEKSNGEPSPFIRNPSASLVENEYVIRTSLTNIKNIGKADKSIVYRRLGVISTYHNVKLTPRKIRDSGMLIMAKDLFLKSGELGDKEYNIIAKRFNLPKLKNDKYNLYRIKQEFLNVEKIKELYKL